MGSIRGMELGGQDGDVDYLSTGSSVSGRPSSQVVVDQIPPSSKTCYVSNLAPTSSTTVTDLAALFSRFGSILQLRQGCGSAVIEMSTHEHAATAIAELTSYEFHGQPLKCSVGHVPIHPDLALRHGSGITLKMTHRSKLLILLPQAAIRAPPRRRKFLSIPKRTSRHRRRWQRRALAM